MLRVLRRSYGLLVSMAPIVSHAETVFSFGSGVPHCGPAAAISVSPWLRLFAYAAVGAGAPSVILRRGVRVRSLPPPVADEQWLLLTDWAGESSTVATSAALLSLNELLLQSPVLVQAYRPQPTHLLHVPFPVAAADVAADLPGCAAAAAVVAALGLRRAFGFVQLLRREGGWVPLDVHLGLPLFDASLCKHVCAAAERDGLFTDASARQMADETGRLLDRLAAFATRHAPPGQDGLVSWRPEVTADAAAAAQPPPMPTRDLVFDGRVLREMDEAAA
jgi:hypothetical protein